MAAKIFRSPETLIARFIAGRTFKSAAFWGVIFAMSVASKAVGIAQLYPTAQSRLELNATFGSNVGLAALMGNPTGTESVGAYAVWNTLNIMMIIGSIWALVTATGMFRGSEESGRWELLLTGRTTARAAARNGLLGLGISLLVLFAVSGLGLISVGQLHQVNYSPGGGLYFALAAVAGAAEFLAVGVLASQLMPTRGRASGLAAVTFAAFFLIRAAADVTKKGWLLACSPLGWIEKLQPLSTPHPAWLIPIVGFVVLVGGLAVYLAGKRDLGDSVIADTDARAANTRLLGAPLPLAVRLTRGSMLSWTLGLAGIAAFFGVITKSAGDVFSQSQQSRQIFARLADTDTRQMGAELYLGVIFMMLMLVLMAYAAGAVGAMRQDEAEGHLDNLVVQPVSRLRWLGGRIFLAAMTAAIAVVAATLCVWAGTASQGVDVGFHDLLMAGLNMLAPASLIFGVALCAFGLAPRLTGIISYGLIAWSFIVQMLSSGLNLNKWILDSSVLHHVALAPAAAPNWHDNWIMIGLSLLLALIGALAFNRRDLTRE